MEWLPFNTSLHYLKRINWRLAKMTREVDALKAAVQRVVAGESQAAHVLAQIKVSLDTALANGADPAVFQDLANQLSASQDALDVEVAKDVPVAVDPAPAVVPVVEPVPVAVDPVVVDSPSSV